jgi:N-acetylneuraminate lyase
MQVPNFRLIAAAFTPMHADGSLNLPAISAQVKHLLASGVQGVFIGGTSGEGQSLTVQERETLAEEWVSACHHTNLELFVHVGHNCLRDAIRLAGHAAAIGADKIGLHAPTWFKCQSAADVLEFAFPVATAASRLPFYFYDIPSVTGFEISAAQFLEKASRRIPNLAGIKYSNPDCITAQECIQFDSGKYDILWGTDETLLVGLTLGASGAVGSTYNFAAPLYLRIVNAVSTEDWRHARTEQASAIAMARIIEQFPVLAALKAAMQLHGIDCGPVRPPMRNLSDTQMQQLLRRLDEFTGTSADARVRNEG